MGQADRITALTEAMQRAVVPQTVSELAETTGLTPSTAYAAIKAMQRTGRAEKKGVAFNGGQTWALTRDQKES